MRGNKRRDNGLAGYRLQWRAVPGRPDIAYPGRKIAIFMHGCFWHRCPRCNPSEPKSNTAFWQRKFELNVERDSRKITQLEDAGWIAVVVWECVLRNDAPAVVERISTAVRASSERRSSC